MQQHDVQFHIRCKEGDVGGYCILPGDPGRCEAIAAQFDDARLVSQTGNTPSIPACCWAKR